MSKTGFGRMPRIRAGDPLSTRLIRLMSVSLVALVVSSCSLFATSRRVAHDWALKDVDGTTPTLIVAVGSSSCDHLQGVEMEETPAEVRLTALVAERDAGSGLFPAGCTDDLLLKSVDVVLEQPLAQRTLIGCAPGDEGLQDYFGQIDGRRISADCAELIS